MTRRGRLLALFGLVAACTLAGCASGPAVGDRAPADETPCATVTQQSELTRCWATAAQAAERAAQAQWASAVAAVAGAGAEPGALLDAGQNDWLRYRDRTCSLFALRVSGGSASTMAGAVCRWRLARERETELRRVIDAFR